jgi:hypothetical protein
MASEAEIEAAARAAFQLCDRTGKWETVQDKEAWRRIVRAALEAARGVHCTEAADWPTKAKADYVCGQSQSRYHECHWPGCNKQVPPAMWGCKKHWFLLPRDLRNKVWHTYRPGQEITLTPSKEYVAVAREVQDWIRRSEGRDP